MHTQVSPNTFIDYSCVVVEITRRGILGYWSVLRCPTRLSVRLAYDIRYVYLLLLLYSALLHL